MSEPEMQTVAVIGAGTMGGGIASICLQSGLDVNLFDPDGTARERTKERVAKRSPAEALEARFKVFDQLAAACATADFVIEAVPELLDLKREIFRELDAITPERTILATNTSELSVTAIAAATQRPDRVIGMHWFNPPERMLLIEVVRGLETSDATSRATRRLAERCGKTTVTVADRQGFVTTRALAALLGEAVRMLEEGVATAEDIDTAVKLGLNHPMGPLELADYVGLDTVLYISDAMTDAIGERFRAAQTLRKLVEAGRLGRKSGHGFYRYHDS